MIFGSPDMQGERAMLEPATPLKRNRLYGWVAAAFVIVGALAIARGVWGAERVVPGPHEIVLTAFGKDYDIAGRTIIRLSGPYEDRAACKEAMKRLVLKVTGAKLACFPVEEMRVN